MRKHLIKLISIVLVIVLSTLTLSSCGVVEYINGLFDSESQDPTDNANQNNTNMSNNGGVSGSSHYYGVKTLYSYEDVMDALTIVRQKREVKPTYTVKDMGDDYTVFYQFWEPHYNLPYPIDYDVFFTSQSSGFFYTYIFLNNQACTHEEHTRIHPVSALQAYKEDQDYEKLIYMRDKACIRFVFTAETYRYGFYEIENVESLYYTEVDMGDHVRYIVHYEGNKILQFWSCIKLDDTFFDDFFNSLVTTGVSN